MYLAMVRGVALAREALLAQAVPLVGGACILHWPRPNVAFWHSKRRLLALKIPAGVGSPRVAVQTNSH